MTAPSLILLGHGSNDPQVPQVSHQIREGLLTIRPELDIHVAFLDHCTPSGMQVVNKLVSRGVEEIVFVPRCALGTLRSWTGWCLRPPAAATSGAMRSLRDGPGNGRHITGCPA